jgi:hypothetical protein
MPALPSVPNVIKTTFFQALGTVLWENILYFGFSGSSPTSADLVTFANDLMTKWGAEIIHSASTSANIYGVEMIDLTSDMGASGYSTEAAIAGTDSNAPLPVSCALVVSREIARRYRGGHPRSYLTGFCEERQADAKTWDATFVGEVAAALQTLCEYAGTLTVGGCSLEAQGVNVSYFTGGALRAVPVVDDIDSFVGKDRICSQRRRLGKMGG